ncbi:MAG: ImmA/IrrE family metallo-endopeptidase [Deltaproteobacteria bacterium]|nr:ImmA/IrrE family metallo-endopeptidase [Deltaproteobacteria bacterium]
MDKPRYGYARQLARKLLNDCRVLAPPVDLKSILAQKGYEYIEVDTFLDNVDGLFLRDESDGKIYAAVNANHHVHRQRFSLAHELGHILMNHDLNYYRPYITIDDPPTEKTHTDAELAFEKEANAFAGELLVPLEMLKKEFKNTTDLTQLSKIFCVSPQVASIAVSNHMSSLYK